MTPTERVINRHMARTLTELKEKTMIAHNISPKRCNFGKCTNNATPGYQCCPDCREALDIAEGMIDDRAIRMQNHELTRSEYKTWGPRIQYAERKA
jgi:hypothetical protein